MALDNLLISRVCIHEVHLRDDGKTRVPPTLSKGLFQLNGRPLQAFTSRIIKAFASDSKSTNMAIRDTGAGTVAATCNDISSAQDGPFLTGTEAIANRLADAQTSRNIPGGLCVVFDGTVSYPPRRFVGVMKAELHEGFVKQKDLTATFVDDLFLTPTTKLYKIGLFIASGGDGTAYPGDWEALLYDAHMSSAHRDAAATYFHDAFLGLEIPEDSALLTRRFFEAATDFINVAPADAQARTDLHNSLYTYLKSDQRPQFHPKEFRDAYVPAAQHANFDAAMTQAKVPARAVNKDLKEIKTRLRIRKLSFPNGIQLSGPAESLSDNVKVESVQRDGERWTRVEIRGAIDSQS